MHLIDNSTAQIPSIGNTWFIVFTKHLYHKVTSKKEESEDGAKPYDVDGPESEDTDDASSATTSEATRSGTNTPKEGVAKGSSLAFPVEKAGGKRRKVNKRR